MRKTSILVLPLAVMMCSLLPSAEAQTAPAALPAGQVPAAPAPPVPGKSWGVDFGVEYSSRYHFRGVSLLGDNHVLDPHARFGWNNLAVYYYGYFGDVPGFKSDRYAEADFGTDYTFAFGEKVSLTLGAVTYRYNGAAGRDLDFLDTYEAYGIVSFDTFLTPTLSYYHDVDKVKGGYLSLAFNHWFALGSRLSLNGMGSVGFDFHYNNKEVRQGSLNDVLIGADLRFRVSEPFTIHAMAQHSFSQRALKRQMDSDPRSKPFNASHSVLSAGLSYWF